MDACAEPMHVLSLCSGYGGLDLGLHAVLPCRTVCYVEHELTAAAILVARMEDGSLDKAPIWDDVTTFDGRPWRGVVDIVTAGFPCFAPGTLILTRDGYRPIESVGVGDHVLTHTGRWQPVTAITAKDDAPLRRVVAQGVPGVITTDEHPFYARQRGRIWDNERRSYGRTVCEPAWVNASTLTTSYSIAQVLPPVGEFPEQRNAGNPDSSTSAFWWLVGRYLADGWRVARLNRPEGSGRTVICAAHDEADSLASRIESAGYHAARVTERTVVKFHIVNNELYRFLEQFGSRAHGKLLPGWAFSLDQYRSGALLDGYISGDGYRANNPRGSGAYYRITTVSKALALSVALLAQRAYGVVAGVRRYQGNSRTIIEGRTVNQRAQWFVTIPDRNRASFVEGDYGWKGVKSSESHGRGRVYNLSVADDESYVADGAVVHNCQPFSSAGKQGADSDPRHLWPDIERIIGECRPGFVFLENVPGLLTTRTAGGRRAIELVVDGLRSLDYRVEAEIVSAAEVGAPHKRERIFILGMADADGGRQQPSEPHLRGREPDARRGRSGITIFPPGPADHDAWRRVLAVRPDLAPAVADGASQRCGEGRGGKRGRPAKRPDGNESGLDARYWWAEWADRGLHGYCNYYSLCHSPNRCDGNNCWLLTQPDFDPAIPNDELADELANPAGERVRRGAAPRESGQPAQPDQAVAYSECSRIQRRGITDQLGAEEGEESSEAHRRQRHGRTIDDSRCDEPRRTQPAQPQIRRVADERSHRLDLTRSARLRALGNGVVPAQAAYALRELILTLTREE